MLSMTHEGGGGERVCKRVGEGIYMRITPAGLGYNGGGGGGADPAGR